MKKCPYCGAQVKDDCLFCTECGKPIPQGYVCPHCGASVNNGDAFCQNCGKKIEEHPNDATIQPQSAKGCGNLTIRWDGTWALIDTNISVSVNGNNLGKFSFKEGFETSVPNTSSETVVETKVGICSTKEKIDLNPNENYTYELAYHRMGGWLGFILYDSLGNELRRDKLHWGMWILSFLIPIVGLIYSIVGWKKRPAASYTALGAALIGAILGVRIANHRSDMRQFIDDIKNRNNTTLVQDTDSIGEVLNETEDTSDADIKLIIDWYKYVLGGSPTENDMKRFLSSDVMNKIWTDDYEGCYMFWRFRTTAQDSKPDNDISEIEEINIEGGGWYTVKYKDMGWDGKTKVKVMDGKIVDFEKDVSWKSWDNEGVEEVSEHSNSPSGYESLLSDRKLTDSDLTYKTKKELELMRNSIYARHGYRFKRDDLFTHFSQYSWYNPTTSDMAAVYNTMSDIEKYNVDFIKKHE